MTGQFLLNTFWPYLNLTRFIGQFACKKVFDTNDKLIGLKLIRKEAFVRFWLILGLLTAVLSGSVYFYITENNVDVTEFFYNFFLLGWGLNVLGWGLIYFKENRKSFLISTLH